MDGFASVWPIADELGDGRFLAALARRRDRAASHARQRDVYRRSGSMPEVVATLTRELDDDFREHAWPSGVSPHSSSASIA
jgi:hypothetical protein